MLRRSILIATLALATSCASVPQDHDRHAIFFAPDSADPGPDGRDLAKRLAGEIRSGGARSVRIEAHANKMPDGSENLVLARFPSRDGGWTSSSSADAPGRPRARQGVARKTCPFGISPTTSRRERNSTSCTP